MIVTFADNASKIKKEVARVEITPQKDTRVKELSDGTTILSVGIGKKKDAVTRRNQEKILRKIVQSAKGMRFNRIAIATDEIAFSNTGMSEAESGQSLGVNFELANYEYNELKSKPPDGWPSVDVVVIVGKTSKEFKEGVLRGLIMGSEINHIRTLCNTPGGDMTPSMLAEDARRSSKGLSIKTTILDKKDMEKLQMGAVLGVAKGSIEEPKFIVLEYWGAGKPSGGRHDPDRSPIVLVGKGVTFDTGGLNLKPGDSMNEMHMDMTGGAIAIHTVVLAAKLKLKKNVIALVPAVENMPSGSSYHPGDVLKSLSGKGIEILNTDAEGRVILADALTYAKRYNPSFVIDIATLTGAVLVALGQHASGIMTRNEEILEDIKRWGEESGDYVWPLPLWDEYEDYIKGNFGDVSNIASSGNSRYGGTINGGMFLYQFTKDYPADTKWMHIDMASRMTAAPSDNLSRGATGEPTRLLLKIIEEYKKK